MLIVGALTPTAKLSSFDMQKSFNIQNVDCVAEAVYFEARGEPQEGWAAVTEVIHNRAIAENIDYCQVIKKSRDVATKDGIRTVYQFSYNQYPKIIKNRALYNQIYNFVSLHLYNVIAEDKRVLSKDVKHYDGKDRTPYWAKNMNVDRTIGGHTFYKENKNG